MKKSFFINYSENGEDKLALTYLLKCWTLIYPLHERDRTGSSKLVFLRVAFFFFFFTPDEVLESFPMGLVLPSSWITVPDRCLPNPTTSAKHEDAVTILNLGALTNPFRQLKSKTNPYCLSPFKKGWDRKTLDYTISWLPSFLIGMACCLTGRENCVNGGGILSGGL